MILNFLIAAKLQLPMFFLKKVLVYSNRTIRNNYEELLAFWFSKNHNWSKYLVVFLFAVVFLFFSALNFYIYKDYNVANSFMLFFK